LLDLNNKLSVFTGSQNAVRPKVIMGYDFDSMLEDFPNQFKTVSFTFVIPKDYAGKKNRMTLKNKKVESAYLEGSFVKVENSYRFENVQYSSGFESEVGVGM